MWGFGEILHRLLRNRAPFKPDSVVNPPSDMDPVFVPWPADPGRRVREVDDLLDLVLERDESARKAYPLSSQPWLTTVCASERNEEVSALVMSVLESSSYLCDCSRLSCPGGTKMAEQSRSPTARRGTPTCMCCAGPPSSPCHAASAEDLCHQLTVGPWLITPITQLKQQWRLSAIPNFTTADSILHWGG